jgi:hypothetical protein
VVASIGDVTNSIGFANLSPADKAEVTQRFADVTAVEGGEVRPARRGPPPGRSFVQARYQAPAAKPKAKAEEAAKQPKAKKAKK